MDLLLILLIVLVILAIVGGLAVTPWLWIAVIALLVVLMLRYRR